MKVDVLNMEGNKVKTVDLPAAIFEAPINVDLMHQAFQRQMANARLGTHETKTRSEVRGTGRARQGSTRAPHWRGGGGVHTPHMHSYVQAMPKRMRAAAVCSALSAKAADSGIVIVDELALVEPKTRLMAKALGSLVGDNSALILIPEKSDAYEAVVRSTRNIPDAKILVASYLNVRDLMLFDRIILPLAALERIEAQLG
jgi:large subunit ribosomal protein L4